MAIGIYELRFNNGAFYIGRSINMEHRYRDHLGLLKRLKHPNIKVQNTYTKYGVPSLHILEICDILDIKDKEVFWITTKNAVEKGLNICGGGEDVLVGEKHPMSKYTNAQILEVVSLLAVDTPSVLSHKEISDITKVSDSIVKDIVGGRCHLWVKEEYPELYEKMLKTKSLRKGHSLNNLNPFANKKVDEYPLVESPSGEVFKIEHLTNFAKEHGLQASNLCKVLSGVRQHHKGWKLCT